MKNRKGLLTDITLNLFACAVNIGTLQVIVLPLLARNIDSDKYGLVLSLVSVFSILPQMLGGTLNNLRLLKQKNEQQGDYNVIFLIMEVITIVGITAAQCILEKRFDFLNIVLSLAVALLMLFNDYNVVAFRIQLNYRRILLYNCILSVGYVVGVVLAISSSYWQFIFLAGYLFGTLYLMATTSLWREPLVCTPSFKGIATDTSMLVVSNLLNRLLNYADKIVAYPFLGGTAIAIINCATFFTKILTLAINPISMVALSYISRMKRRPDKLFKTICLTGALFSIAGYIVCVIIAKPVMTLIYPQFARESLKYVSITSAATMIMLFNTILQPFTLKFSPLKWQIMINGVTFATYLVSMIWLLDAYRIMGVCVASLISRSVRCFFLLVTYLKSKRCEC